MKTTRKSVLACWLLAMALPLVSGCGGAGLTEDDGVSVDHPFAYVVRTFPEIGDISSVDARPPLDPRAPYQFNPGARLMVRDRISLDSEERHVLAGYFSGGAYDVKDLDVSPDGEHLIFAAHGPEADPRHNSWNIYEYNFSTGEVRRIFKDDGLANMAHDTNPAYTNDGRIIFSSSRQISRGDFRVADSREYIEDFGEPASLLHVVNRDGSNLVQITFGNFHDVEASSMDDGQIVFIRWGRVYESLQNCTEENIDDPNFNTHPHGGGYGQGNGNDFPSGLDDPKTWTEADKCGASVEDTTTGERLFVEDVLSLYRITPNGGNMHRYFGNLSQEFSDASYIHYMDPIPLKNGNLVTIMRHIYNPVYGGDVVKINSSRFYAVGKPVSDDISGTAEQSMTPGLVNFYPSQVSPTGWYSSVAPYRDGSGRLLAAWAQCLLDLGEVVDVCQGSSTTNELAKPRFGIWAVDPSNNTRLPVVQGHRNALYTDVAIGNYNEFARVYSGVQLALTLEDNIGVFHIRSIYDRDGVDMAEPDGGIETRRDPSMTPPDSRSERFIRVVGLRDIPGELRTDVLTNPTYNPDDGSNTQLGLTPILGSGPSPLYDVLGYGRVEPDGSAMIKVPAETRFSFQVVNKYGKRVDLIAEPDYNYNYLVQHPQALVLEEGEVVACYGCHDAENDIPHARTDVMQASANPGAPADGAPFPNANPEIRALNYKDTMARALTDFQSSVTDNGGDIIYNDYWTDPATGTPAAPFRYRYAGLNTPLPLNDPSCTEQWRSDCKTTINYLEHIQPIWDSCRALPVSGDIKACTSCHDKADNNHADDCPGGGGSGGDLILSGDGAPWDPRQVQSYVELFKPDYYQKSVAGEWVEVTDIASECPDGIEGELTVLPAPGVCFTRRLMSARGAIASARFFSLFDNDPDDDAYEVDATTTGGGGGSVPQHMGMLSEAELRLIAEWLDTGAHLYNDPEDVPLP